MIQTFCMISVSLTYGASIMKRKRRNRKQERKLRLFVSIFLCIGIVVILSTKFLVRLNAGREKVVTSVEFQKRKENRPMEVECILQNPELPTGCEATAGTILLKAYGYEAEKMEVARYMTKGEYIVDGDVMYAGHPDEMFIGDPETLNGYGAFPQVLAKAMQMVIDSQDGEHRAKPLYGLKQDEILNFIDEGKPVCVWTSMDDKEIEYRRSWYLIKNGEYSEERFCWPSNEHVVVLTAYDGEHVTVCDPLKGKWKYPIESFFRHYSQVGSYALVLEDK